MIIDKWNRIVESDSIVIDSSIIFKNGEKWEVPERAEFICYLQSKIPSLERVTTTGSVSDMIVLRGMVKWDQILPTKILELSKEICMKYGCMFNQFIIKDEVRFIHKKKKGLRDQNFSLIIFAKEASTSMKTWK